MCMYNTHIMFITLTQVNKLSEQNHAHGLYIVYHYHLLSLLFSVRLTPKFHLDDSGDLHISIVCNIECNSEDFCPMIRKISITQYGSHSPTNHIVCINKRLVRKNQTFVC